jgi:hypothetical protein
MQRWRQVYIRQEVPILAPNQFLSVGQRLVCGPLVPALNLTNSQSLYKTVHKLSSLRQNLPSPPPVFLLPDIDLPSILTLPPLTLPTPCFPPFELEPLPLLSPRSVARDVANELLDQMLQLQQRLRHLGVLVEVTVHAQCPCQDLGHPSMSSTATLTRSVILGNTAHAVSALEPWYPHNSEQDLAGYPYPQHQTDHLP